MASSREADLLGKRKSREDTPHILGSETFFRHFHKMRRQVSGQIRRLKAIEGDEYHCVVEPVRAIAPEARMRRCTWSAAPGWQEAR